MHDIDSVLAEHGSYRFLTMTYSCDFLKNDRKPLEVVPTARKDGYIKYKEVHKSALVGFETIMSKFQLLITRVTPRDT